MLGRGGSRRGATHENILPITKTNVWFRWLFTSDFFKDLAGAEVCVGTFDLPQACSLSCRMGGDAGYEQGYANTDQYPRKHAAQPTTFALMITWKRTSSGEPLLDLLSELAPETSTAASRDLRAVLIASICSRQLSGGYGG